MALINDEATVEIVGGMKAARNVAYEQIERSKTRLRSTSKTRKSRETRKRIMEAASKLIVERRSVLFQMSEVSDLCHMSKGSLYYYFSDRDELIGAIFDESIDSLVDQIEGVAARAESARAALLGLCEEIAKRLREGSVLSLAMTHEMVGGSRELAEKDVTTRFMRVAEVIAAQIERAKTEGVIREDVDSYSTSIFVMGGFLTTAMVVAYGRGAEDTDALVKRLMNTVMGGVGVEGVTLG